MADMPSPPSLFLIMSLVYYILISEMILTIHVPCHIFISALMKLTGSLLTDTQTIKLKASKSSTATPFRA